jgi:homoserine O-acetyltransferase
MVSSIIPVATSAQHSTWAVAFNHLARQAIMNDPAWNGGSYTEQPERGMALARQIGMISYRTDISFQARFGRALQEPEISNNGRGMFFQVESYLNYQGEKLVKRFDANAFLTITRALDGHDLARDRGSLQQALSLIQAPALCIGIDTDILYPAQEQREIAAGISGARYAEIKSSNGHDGFLIEFEQLQKIVQKFLAEIGY